MATNKRKKAVAATVAAAALLLAGTFAWTSISQTALNEAIVDINPGGRLHDDFNGKTLDVYVENFNDAEDAAAVPIFARVKLTEYMEVGQEAGKKKIADDTRKALPVGGGVLTDTDTWDVYTPTEDTITNPENVYSKYWNWTMGNDSTAGRYYMPTFNKNKDSLEADINGTYEGTIEDDIVHYDDYRAYAADDTETDYEYYDWDENTIWEGPEHLYPLGAHPYEDGKGEYEVEDMEETKSIPIDTYNVVKTENQHKAEQLSSTAQVMTMNDWLALPEDEQVGQYWVYDTDGWAYWAQPIEPGKTTGLLMDGINMHKVPDDNWYYGINVVGQFVTAGDVGSLHDNEGNGSGFYMNGETVSENAQTLLEAIGVITGDQAGEENGEPFSVIETEIMMGQENYLSLSYDMETYPDVYFEAGNGGSMIVNDDIDNDIGGAYWQVLSDVVTIDLRDAEGDVSVGDTLTFDVVMYDNETGEEVSSVTHTVTVIGEELGDAQLTFDYDTEIPMAIPEGSTINLGIDNYEAEDQLRFYLVNHANNSDLEKGYIQDAEGNDLEAYGKGFYTSPLEAKDGLQVVGCESTIAGNTFTEYFYGEEVSDSWVATFGDDSASNGAECIMIVALDGNETVATAITKIYDSTAHNYVGSNSNTDITEDVVNSWQLVFEALDANRNVVGYCAMNAAQTVLETYKFHPAEVTVTDDAHACLVKHIDEDTICDGSHSTAVDTDALKLYANGAELTNIEVGGAYDLTVKAEEDTKTVKSWAVSGNKSTGTKIDDQGNLTVGYFEDAQDIKILATLEGEYFANSFTVNVSGSHGLTDISDSHAIARENGSDSVMIYDDGSYWPGSIISELYVVEKASFESMVTTVQTMKDTGMQLTNLKSMEVIGDDLGAVTVDGSLTIGEETIHYGIVGKETVNFRTNGEASLVLYVIMDDGKFIRHNISIVDDMGE